MQAKSILVIDKDIITRKFLKQTLEKRGYRVAQSDLGKDGLILAWRDTPDLIIVDPLLPDIEADIFIKKIRQDPRTAYTPVIALSVENSSDFGKNCIIQGYTLYFPKEGNAIPDLLNQLEELKSNSVTPLVEKRERGKMLAFLSGKGGSGVSSIAANTAAALKGLNQDAKVVLVDMVFPVGSLAAMLGYQGSINIATLADLPSGEINPEIMQRALPHINAWKINLLAGLPDPEFVSLLQSNRIPHILDILVDEFDYVLIDLGRSLSRASIQILEKADLINLIITPEKENIRLAKIIKSHLHSLQISTKLLYPILNQNTDFSLLNEKQAEAMLGTEIESSLPYMKEYLSNANAQAEALIYKYPNESYTFTLLNLANAILKRTQIKAA